MLVLVLVRLPPGPRAGSGPTHPAPAAAIVTVMTHLPLLVVLFPLLRVLPVVPGFQL